MAREVEKVDRLRDYLGLVLARADHHAQGVSDVALAIAGGVIWTKDDTPIRVLDRDGDMKNVLWFRVAGRRYAFSYNHDTGEIELRKNSLQGKVIASFSNETTNTEVRDTFESL